MSEHTPGPWKAMHPDSGLICHAEDDVFIAQAFCERSINQIDPVPRNEQGEANARLIAAAPELLAALKGLVAGFDHTSTILEWETMLEALRVAREVIAKAKVQS